MSAAYLGRLSSAIEDLRARDLLRSLEARQSAQSSVLHINGQRLVNFTSNDYLGLAAHPYVVASVTEALGNHGFGAGGAALLSGRSSLHEELERRLAEYVGCDRALMFSSGYLANTGALPALVTPQDHVFSDRLNHASLIDGVRASRAQVTIYDHDTLPALDQVQSDRQSLVVTESLFSMDGDFAPLEQIAARAADHAAVLYVDDAHGFGISGGGRGAGAALCGHTPAATFIMITLGKALGSAGAVIAGPDIAIEFLLQRARTFIFDTAPPAVCAAAALAALELLQSDPAFGQRLDANIKRFHGRTKDLRIPVMPSKSPIQPVLVGEEAHALRLARFLNDRGFYVRAVRPPTVPPGTARIRITLSAAHTETQIDNLAAALGEGFAHTAAA